MFVYFVIVSLYTRYAYQILSNAFSVSIIIIILSGISILQQLRKINFKISLFDYLTLGSLNPQKYLETDHRYYMRMISPNQRIIVHLETFSIANYFFTSR